MTQRYPLVLVLPLVLAASLTLGCEEDVTVIVGTERPYTVYGLFSPDLDTQWVRVFPVEPRLQERPAGALDAVVTSRDFVSGEERVWQDSVIQESSGLYEHAFWSVFEAEYDHAYELRVARSDGAVSSAEVAVPPLVEILIEDPEISAGFVTQDVVLSGDAPQIFNIEVTYTVDFALSSPGPRPNGAITLSYDSLKRRQSEGWVIPLNLRADYFTIRDYFESAQVPVDPVYGIRLLGISLRLVVGNEEWAPPGGIFDPELLAEPGAMTNVDNGFGFVGAGYETRRTWLPSAAARDAAGFTVPASQQEP